MIKLKDLVSETTRHDIEYQTGVNLARQDALQGVKRDLSKYSPDFVKGYKTIEQPGLLSKVGSWVTKKATDLGHSYAASKRFGS